MQEIYISQIFWDDGTNAILILRSKNPESNLLDSESPSVIAEFQQEQSFEHILEKGRTICLEEKQHLLQNHPIWLGASNL